MTTAGGEMTNAPMGDSEAELIFIKSQLSGNCETKPTSQQTPPPSPEGPWFRPHPSTQFKSNMLSEEEEEE